MKASCPFFFSFALNLWLFFAVLSHAGSPHFYHVSSPNHEQTFANGTETNRVWKAWGRDQHLALLLDFTNDPFVDRQNQREYDNFIFSFPNVKLGKNGHTFYYHAPDGRVIPIADQHPAFLGLDEVRLLPNAELLVEKPHGYLSLTLEVHDPG